MSPFLSKTALLSLLITVALFTPNATTSPTTPDLKSQTVTILNDPSSSSNITAQLLSQPSTFTAPKLLSINNNVFQWWYFSGISTDAKTSIVVIFFTTLPNAFPPAEYPGVTSINIQLAGPHGASALAILPADSATFKWGGPLGAGIQGSYSGPNVGLNAAAFNISSSLQSASLTVDGYSAIDGTHVTGTMSLVSTGNAPPHYPCSSNRSPGQTLEIFPHLGWTNAIPAATATANFTVNGTTFALSGGAGYADQNWADAPFTELVQAWYWARINLGPYTIVLFDGLDNNAAIGAGNSSEHVVGYVAKGGEILLSTCTPGSVKVRPMGKGAMWPPTPKKGEFAYLAVEVNVGGKDGVLEFNLTKSDEVVEAPGFYHRWIGHAVGGVKGCKEVLKGVAEWEEFTVD